jgi:hypothetical protein
VKAQRQGAGASWPFIAVIMCPTRAKSMIPWAIGMSIWRGDFLVPR